jgi:hypothetical protein
MFKALILLCVIGQPNQCAMFEDTTGLKATEKECRARAREMAKSIGPMFPMPVQAHYKCKKGAAT